MCSATGCGQLHYRNVTLRTRRWGVELTSSIPSANRKFTEQAVLGYISDVHLWVLHILSQTRTSPCPSE